MYLKNLYNDIAANYSPANRFGSLTLSHESAVKQIQQILSKSQNSHILDLGVGDGQMLKLLFDIYPHSTLTGIDISKNMLSLAQKKLPLKTIETSALLANQFVAPHSQDLVLAHFINAYIPIDKLFEQAHLLTKANGYFSMITTTYDSFPVAQKYLAEFISEGSLISRVVGHYYKAIVRNTAVAANQDELLKTFDQHQFDVVHHERIVIPIVLNNVNELAEFGIEGTWFLNTLTIKMLPKNFLIAKLKKIFSHIFSFPYQDIHVIDVVLAKKR